MGHLPNDLDYYLDENQENLQKYDKRYLQND